MEKALHKLPQEFLHKLKRIYPSSYNQIMASFMQKRLPAFRINYLKTDLHALRRELRNQRVKFGELAFPRGAFALKTPLREFQRTDIYRGGKVYVQNLSSMLPVICLDPQNSDKILDLCAAPGAKTTQIVSLAPEAEVVAIEKIRTRYYKLLANLKLQGAAAVKAELFDSIWVRKKYPEQFDKILADVPCSAEGRFFIQNPKSFKYWKERKVKEMRNKQKRLLHAAFFALKEGGTLVYSTCTFSPEENEGIIDWFIDRFKGKLEVLPLGISLKNAREGLSCWQNKRFSAAVRLTRRIVPDNLMEGFYIAKLRKVSF